MQKEMENVLSFLEFDFRDIIEFDYLITILNKFNAIEDAKEGIFQFHPKYNDKGRSQKFSSFYKEMILNQIIFQILELIFEILKKDFINKNDKNILLNISNIKNILDLNDELFIDYFYLNEKYHKNFILFIVKNNFQALTKKEIVECFQNNFIKELNLFFN
jgi:hypothetical protein